MANPKKADKKRTKKDYEDLGRIVAKVYETGYLDSAKSYKESFIKGMFQGFGAFIGATILAALLIWAMSLFNEVPLIGRFVENIQTTIEQQP